jgi:hypothetical protein
MVDNEHGHVVGALHLAQESEHGAHLGGAVLVSCDRRGYVPSEAGVHRCAGIPAKEGT